MLVTPACLTGGVSVLWRRGMPSIVLMSVVPKAPHQQVGLLGGGKAVLKELMSYSAVNHCLGKRCTGIVMVLLAGHRPLAQEAAAALRGPALTADSGARDQCAAAGAAVSHALPAGSRAAAQTERGVGGMAGHVCWAPLWSTQPVPESRTECQRARSGGPCWPPCNHSLGSRTAPKPPAGCWKGQPSRLQELSPRKPFDAALISPPGCALGCLWLSPTGAAAPARSCSPAAPHWSHASAAGNSQRQQSPGSPSVAAL